MLLSELGAELRKARKDRHLTLKQVAERARVHFTTLSLLERGEVSDLGVRKLLRVAETVGLELVLRPEGQRYTLDDVAQERAGLLSGAHTTDLNRQTELAKVVRQRAVRFDSTPSSHLEDFNRQNELVEHMNQPSGLLGSTTANPLEDFNKQNELAKLMNQPGGLLGSATFNPLEDFNKQNELAKLMNQPGGLLGSTMFNPSTDFRRQVESANASTKADALLSRALRAPITSSAGASVTNDESAKSPKKS